MKGGDNLVLRNIEPKRGREEGRRDGESTEERGEREKTEECMEKNEKRYWRRKRRGIRNCDVR